MSLFQLGDFKLASGKKSPFKIECDHLTEDDWKALALLLVDRVPRFGEVHGVPTGGEPFAKALEEYADPRFRRILLVDDVWTTGGSIEKFSKGFDSGWIGAVAFARSPVPYNVVALFQLTTTKVT